jgi:hypothetical protein
MAGPPSRFSLSVCPLSFRFFSAVLVCRFITKLLETIAQSEIVRTDRELRIYSLVHFGGEI